MRFLSDQDVYGTTVKSLRSKGHDVVTAKELGMQRASDEELLKKAVETNRLLITRDKDFGALVFLRKELSAGVIFMRVTPATLEDVHEELFRLLQEHREDELSLMFCVVEPNRHRVRRLS